MDDECVWNGGGIPTSCVFCATQATRIDVGLFPMAVSICQRTKEVLGSPGASLAGSQLKKTSLRFACAAFLHSFPLKHTTPSGGRSLVFDFILMLKKISKTECPQHLPGRFVKKTLLKPIQDVPPFVEKQI